MPYVLVSALLTLLLSATGSRAEELLPRPEGLEPNVRFWVRVYTEVDGRGGLIHDSEHLDVVYEVVRFDPGLSERARERRVDRSKDRYRAILRRLASGKRTDLSAEQAAVLALWPDGVSNKTLSRAARRLRFQLGQADKFRAGLIRSGAWRAYIERSLTDSGVPVELAALPHVESSYNPKAYSRVGAAGMWQFTRPTGRRYLRVDHVVDERLDPFKSTRAAARLLRDNHRQTRTWPLAITAYNHGAAGMRRAARKLGTTDIATIVRRYKSRSFGFASRNFYASFLAALQVDRNATHYFGPLRADPPVEYQIVELPHFYPAKSLQSALGIEQSVLRDHNTALRPSVWSGSKFVPRGYDLRVPRHLLAGPPEALLARVPTAERLDRQHRDRYYKVRRGDTLSRIASRYGVRQSELVALNNLRSRHRIHVGQVLVMPDDARGGVQPAPPVAIAPIPSDGIHRVRGGETLSRIARRYGVTEAQLVELNGLRNRHHLVVGQRLRLPGAESEKEPVPAAPVITASTRPLSPPTPAATAATLPAEETSPETLPVEPPGLAARSDAGAVPTDPSDYSVSPDGRITVQAAETLGHYAEWLGVRASTLRRINGLRYGRPLAIGRRIALDFRAVSPEEFERIRLEFHRTLQEEFFSAYVVTGTEEHVLEAGDTLWELAQQRYRLPVWLLRQYNPDLDFAALPAGAQMVIPRIAARES